MDSPLLTTVHVPHSSLAADGGNASGGGESASHNEDAGPACVSWCRVILIHYNDVIMGAMASQITRLTIVYSTVYSSADQRKHQSSAPLAFVRRIHRRPVNSPHKWPVTRKMFPFDDVIMESPFLYVLN